MDVKKREKSLIIRQVEIVDYFLLKLFGEIRGENWDTDCGSICPP